jgi:hypothetical protein
MAMSLRSEAGSFMMPRVLTEARRPNGAIGKNLKEFRQQAEAATFDATIAANLKALRYG